MSDKIGEKMKLKKSYADTDSMYIDCDRKENESFRGKIAELDDLIDNIHNRVGEIVFDELSILLNSADVEMAGVLYPQRISKDSDITRLRIAIEDQSGGGYLNFDFSYHELVSEFMGMIEDDEEKERAIELAKQLRIIADEIESSIKLTGKEG